MLDPRQKIRRHLYDRNPIQDGLDDVQGRAVEQQAVAAANGTPTGKIAAADDDRHYRKGRGINPVERSFTHVHQDEM
jgi:hypothetical protein